MKTAKFDPSFQSGISGVRRYLLDPPLESGGYVAGSLMLSASQEDAERFLRESGYEVVS